MQETVNISKKQFSITISFSLMMLCTTGSLQVFASSCAQFVLFYLINILSIRFIRNRRVCQCIFAVAAALIGEAVQLLSQFLSFNIPMPSFFLLPGSTFLFLSAPMFRYMMENEETAMDSGYASGFLFYALNGGIIAMIREVLGADALFGKKLGIFGSVKVEILNHSSGATLLLILSILFLVCLKNYETEKKWILDVKRETPLYEGMSFLKEKKFFSLMVCMLLTDVICGGISVVYLLYSPDFLRYQGHVIFYAAILSILLFTLLLQVFNLREEAESSHYLTLVTIVKVSLPLVFYLRRLLVEESMALSTFVVWWIALVIGIWFSFTVVLFYVHVLDRRLMFCKIPRCLQGILFIILNILLAQMILMPLLDVISNV